MGDWHRSLVCSTRAFRSGGQWMWGVLVVPFDCHCGCTISRLPVEWWRVSVGNGAIGATHLGAMPGPLDLADRGGEGMWLVASDRRSSWQWHVIAGGNLAAPWTQCHMLLCNMGAFPGHKRSVEGGACSMNMVGGGTPSHRCIGVGPLGQCLLHVACTRVSRALRPLYGAALVPSSVVGMAALHCGGGVSDRARHNGCVG